MQNFWDERYASSAYVYGIEPNQFFKEQIAKLQPGKLLLPAEGEGRNAVFSAKLGWRVSAFDQSKEGQKKATLLAEKNKVEIQYQVSKLSEVDYKPASFDCMALIYAHFPAKDRTRYHQKLNDYVRKGGILILEGFSKAHLQVNVDSDTSSGPKDLGMLFSKEEILNDFPNYEILLLEVTVETLTEGSFHNDKSAILRFIGKKK